MTGRDSPIGGDEGHSDVKSSVLAKTGPRYLGGSRVISDLVAVILAVEVVLLADWGAAGALVSDPSRVILALVIPAIWMGTLWLTESRAISVLADGWEEYRRVISASLWMLVLTAAFAYFTNATRARVFMLSVAALGTVVLLLFRRIMRSMLHRMMAKGHPLTRVYLVGGARQIESVRSELMMSEGRFAEVGNWIVADAEPDPETVVGRALALGADAILLLPTQHTDPAWTRSLSWAMELSGISLMVSPALVDVASARMRVEPVSGMAFVAVELPNFTGPELVVKRAMDLAGAVAGLVLMAVPMAIIAVAVKLDSRGPALFRQQRRGIGDTTFTCVKFRTMTSDAESQAASLRAAAGDAGATFKLVEDPRVTRVGKFLRRTSLDEVPQLWNVLRSDMSLVGPRPHQLSDTQRYDDISSRRLLAKPGMTGLWQVSGRSDTSWQQNVDLDLYYVENWSLSLDLAILLRTVGAVVRGDGAY